VSAGLRLALEVPGDRFPVRLDWETDESALGLFGPSGAGKTSVLEAIAGVRRGARGRIEVAGATWLDSARGVVVPPEDRGVGYVPQDLRLFPHLDVLGNLRVGERRARRSGSRAGVDRVLEVLELEPLARRDVATLSGGERQRVALGRALCSAPRLLLLDEPLASLDQRLRRRILPYLLRIRRELRVPTIHVSHDAAELRLLASEVAVLEAGRCVGRGPAEQVFGGEALRRGAELESIVNVLEGEVVRKSESLATVAVGPGLEIALADDAGLAVGDRVAIELRAGDVLLARGEAARISAQNVLAGTVVAIDSTEDGPHPGVVVTCALDDAGHRLSALLTRKAVHELELAEGCRAQAVFKAQACRLLAAY
jgi:molybdate transport system ATP-binding protein